MKKYIIPSLNVVNIETGDTLTVTSMGVDTENGTSTQYARRRAHRGRNNYDDVDIYFEDEDEDF